MDTTATMVPMVPMVLLVGTLLEWAIPEIREALEEVAVEEVVAAGVATSQTKTTTVSSDPLVIPEYKSPSALFFWSLRSGSYADRSISACEPPRRQITWTNDLHISLIGRNEVAVFGI